MLHVALGLRTVERRSIIFRAPNASSVVATTMGRLRTNSPVMTYLGFYTYSVDVCTVRCICPSRGAKRGISKRGRLQIGPKRAQTGPNGPNWAFWAFARNAQLGILGIRPKCPIGPIWARLGPIGPIWAQMDTPKRTLNTRHPTSANCGDNLPKTGVKSPRL